MGGQTILCVGVDKMPFARGVETCGIDAIVFRSSVIVECMIFLRTTLVTINLTNLYIVFLYMYNSVLHCWEFPCRSLHVFVRLGPSMLGVTLLTFRPTLAPRRPPRKKKTQDIEDRRKRSLQH